MIMASVEQAQVKMKQDLSAEIRNTVINTLVGLMPHLQSGEPRLPTRSDESQFPSGGNNETAEPVLAQGYPWATPCVPAGEWGWGMVGLKILEVRVIPAMWDPVFGVFRLSVGFVGGVL